MATVLLVDDHVVFRRSARALLEEDGIVVVGEAGTGRDALAMADLLRPDIVVLDIELPDISGFEVAARLTRAASRPSVILTSSRDAEAYGRRVAGTAAVCFIPKDALAGSLVLQMAGR